MKKLHLLILSLLLALAAPAQAQQRTGDTTQARPQVEALVRTVDKSAKKITLRHGEIPNLDMGPMTMVFQVQDAALLDQVKAGDTVRFTADQIKGAYTVLTIVRVN